MDITQILDITQVIKDQCAVYNEVENVTPQEINNGMCEDFANDIAHIGFGIAIWGGNVPLELWSKLACRIKVWFSHFADGHCFIMFNDKFYDSECPQGCNHPDNLPFYQRQLKNYFEE